jgi:hypothetical protein
VGAARQKNTLETPDLTHHRAISPDIRMELVGDVRDRDVIIVDDMIDTASRMTNAARTLSEARANSYACVRGCGLVADVHSRAASPTRSAARDAYSASPRTASSPARRGNSSKRARSLRWLYSTPSPCCR